MHTKVTVTAFLAILFVCCFSCKEGALELPFENAGGYVIGNEQCRMDTTQEYWLVDLSIFPKPCPYGDTLWLDGSLYKNVVKTTGLAPQFRFEGAKVGFDFYLSATPVNSTCDLPNPRTFRLKEMQVLNQAEVR